MDPTLMYSSPVADSIDRLRAVCSAAHDTTSGNTSPTISRSHTNSAHDPNSAANGPPVAPGPIPSPTHVRNSTTWSATTHSSRRETSTSGPSGSLGVTRYQWPRIIAANTPPVASVSTRSCSDRPATPAALPPQVRPPSSRTRIPAVIPIAPGIRARPPRASTSVVSVANTRNTISAVRRGTSNAGSTITGEPWTIAPAGRTSAVSDRYARTPQPTAHAAVNVRKPFVAGGRRRAKTTTANEPIASATSTVQLISARLLAICWAPIGAECSRPSTRGPRRSPDRRWNRCSLPPGTRGTMAAGNARTERPARRRGDPQEAVHGDRTRHLVHVARPRGRGGPDAGRQGDPVRSLARQPPVAADRRQRRPLRPAPRHARARRPHGRCRGARLAAPTGLAMHARDEPVAFAAAPRRLRPGHRVQQGRHGRGRRRARDDGPGGALGRRLERLRGDHALPRRACRVRRGAGERVPDLPRGRHGGVR